MHLFSIGFCHSPPLMVQSLAGSVFEGIMFELVIKVNKRPLCEIGQAVALSFIPMGLDS